MMAFKTSEEMMEMCREVRARSGMTQTEFGASLDEPKSRQFVTYAETDPRPRYDSIRVAILVQKGGYVVTPGYEVKRKA